MKNKEILLVGITGGIGSGKTTVSEYIANKGFKTLSADYIAKDVIYNNSNIKKKIIKAFGESSYEKNKYNAVFIAKRVFDDEDSEYNLNSLNQIVHPAVIQELINQIDLLASSGERIIFVDIPLLFELGLEDGFDYIITICADDAIRLERIKARSDLTEEHIKNRMKRQISQEEKAKYSDFILKNNSNCEELYKGVDFLLSVLETLVQ